MNKYPTGHFSDAIHDHEASASTPESDPDKILSLDLPLAVQIRLAREAKNLSRADLARQLGVSEQAIKNWEKEGDGRLSTPRKKHWDCLEDILDTTLYMSQRPRGNAVINPATAEIVAISKIIATMPRDTRQAVITLIKAIAQGNELLNERN